MQIFEKFGLISRKFCKGNILLTLNKILQLTRNDGAEFSGVTNELHAKRPSLLADSNSMIPGLGGLR